MATTQQRPEGTCCSGKVRFADRETAALELAHVKEKAAAGITRRRECRVYPCTLCFGWHLTSQPPRADGSGVQPIPEGK